MRSSLFLVAVSAIFLGVSTSRTEMGSDTLYLQWARELTLPQETSGNDQAVDIEVDASGNVYVTGKSEGPATSYDFLTVKYGSDGAVQWSARYDGPYHGSDIPSAIAIDNAGNVCVTGTSIGDTTNGDIVTIKYNSSGNVDWVQRYDGQRSWGGDGGVDVAVDVSGFVYVTGYKGDFVTLKYSPDGQLEWTAVYGDSSMFPESPAALRLDEEGNILVTGSATRAFENNGVSDIVTLKYSPAGDLLWDTRYVYSDSISSFPADLVITDDGDVCITGTLRYYPDWGSSSKPIGDIITLRYSRDGVIEWERVFQTGDSDYPQSGWLDEAAGVVTDHSGNLFVLGAVRNDWRQYNAYPFIGDSLLLIKYSPGGSLRWVSYRDAGSEGISAGGIALDQDDNIVITGTQGETSHWPPLTGESVLTIDYNSDGSVAWETSHFPSLGAIGSNAITAKDGFLYVAGFSGPEKGTDFLTLKYSNGGGNIWNSTTTGSGITAGFVRAAEIADDGNVFVASVGIDPENDRNYSVAKVSSSGDILWSAVYNGEPGGPDLVHDIAADASGYVYVTGQSAGVGTNRDYVTIKYDPDGEQLWATRYDSAAEDDGRVLAVGPSGSLYVGGDPSLLKYDAAGNLEWSRGVGGLVTALAVDGTGNVFSLGSELRKYSPSGELRWSEVVGGMAIALDGFGNVYVTNSQSYSTIKFDSSGNELWNCPVGGNRIVVYDPDHVYVSALDWVYCLAADGTVAWIRGPFQPSFTDSDIDIDQFGNLFMAGWDWGDWSTPLVIRTFMYDINGAEQSRLTYARGGGGEYRVASIGLDADGEIFVVGEQIGADFSPIPLVLKYSANVTTGTPAKDNDGVPVGFQLYQNYPNPFNPSTTIRFDLPEAGKVEMMIYNLLGQQVATVLDQQMNAGSHRVTIDGQNLATGAYLYRLKAGGFVAAKKLMLLR